MSRPKCKPVMLGSSTDVVVIQSGWKASAAHAVNDGRAILHLGSVEDDAGAQGRPPVEIYFRGSALTSLRDALIVACTVYNDDGTVYVEPQTPNTLPDDATVFESWPEAPDAEYVKARMCQLTEWVCNNATGFAQASDCFCGNGGWRKPGDSGTFADGYRNEGAAVQWIEAACKAYAAQHAAIAQIIGADA